jgi:hypothetical protein
VQLAGFICSDNGTTYPAADVEAALRSFPHATSGACAPPVVPPPTSEPPPPVAPPPPARSGFICSDNGTTHAVQDVEAALLQFPDAAAGACPTPVASAAAAP